MRHFQQRAVAWLVLLGIALALGLPFDHTTLFWIGILSVWVLI